MNHFKKIIVLICSNIFLIAQTGFIDIITTNDIHGMVGEQSATFMNPQYPPNILGGSAMHSYIKKIKQDTELLILDGGNFFQGHPLGIADSGKFMIDWYNRIGYDAVVPGRYDFILGSKNLNHLIESSNFPFLAANLNCNNCELNSKNLIPYIIKEIKGIRVGIIGIVSSSLKDWVLAENLNGIEIDFEVDALKKWIPTVKDKGADLIVILTSSGVPWDREIIYDKFIDRLKNDLNWNPSDTSLNAVEMAYFAEGADIIISGGVSKGYPLPFYDPNSHVYTFQNFGNGTEFGHFRMRFDQLTKSFIGYESAVKGRISQTTLEDDFTFDKEIKDIIDSNVNDALNYVYNGNINWNKENNNQCGKSFKSKINDWDVPSFNTNDIEIITWNCEFFPAAWDQTINTLSELILDIDADIYAFQEIRYVGWFSRLMELLPNYDFIISQQSSFMDQAIVYRKDMFDFVRQVEPFADNDYNFAGRPPLRGDFIYQCGDQKMELSVINLHSKCCDSGLQRRKNAAQMLHQYVSKEIDDGFSNFIILGDWNDDLRDLPGEHSFDPFLNDERFYFVNLEIINDPKQVTYPKEPYVSFLDHILTTNELLDNSKYYIQTLPIPDYLGGYDVYEELVSDHLPVMLRFSPK